jgi:hypothetical protein
VTRCASSQRSRLRSPDTYRARHPLLPRGTLVGWSPCGCTVGVSGHRTYTCRYMVDGAECGLVLAFRRAVIRRLGRCRGSKARSD